MPLFTKAERLCHQKAIDQIFVQAKFVSDGYVRLFYDFQKAEHSPEFPIKIAFSVPKRKFKLAVTRNRLKRQMREAYRLQKDEFYTQFSKSTLATHVILVYMGKAECDFVDLKLKVQQVFQQLMIKHEQFAG